MNAGAARWEDEFIPSKWGPFGMAFSLQLALIIWNPTILPGGKAFQPPELFPVKFTNTMPVIEVSKPKPPPPKPVEKKAPVKKAKKAGLSLTKKATPVAVSPRKTAPAAKKPFVSRIEIPKFVPRMSDEPIAASPAPGLVAPAPRRMTRAASGVTPLKGKSRGIRAQDVSMKLSDRGSLAAMERAVAIPVAEENDEIVSLPSASAPALAPKAAKTMPGYRFAPGSGSGSGELVGKNKAHHGYHGAARAPVYVEGSLTGGSGKATQSINGQGFELGGPVGDRKILQRRLPEYPDWAEQKGISAIVKIYFTVKPDGTLRSNMRIMHSSGYTDLDQLAKEALLNWKFSPTRASSSEEEAWGIITFRFVLN